MSQLIDSSGIAQVDSLLLESLKEKGDYVYKEPQNDRNLWDLLQEWLWGWLEENGIHLAGWVEDLLTVIGIGLLVYGTYLVLKSRRKIKANKQLSPDRPDLQKYQKEWDRSFLEQNLNQAKAETDWAHAIHWTYHLALVDLNDAHIIKRSLFKISLDYLQEITDPLLQVRFQKLRLLHQRAWYDERECSLQDYERAKLLQEELKKEVSDG